MEIRDCAAGPPTAGIPECSLAFLIARRAERRMPKSNEPENNLNVYHSAPTVEERVLDRTSLVAGRVPHNRGVETRVAPRRKVA